ncbi:hypothetical protein KKJ04_24935, partial [Xenorhabdus bovienii]|uniref:hypothetical protein n=1 Tax=Xenorhabdus bovienii TaxID=40576 RepID=UPI0023B22B11
DHIVSVKPHNCGGDPDCFVSIELRRHIDSASGHRGKASDHIISVEPRNCRGALDHIVFVELRCLSAPTSTSPPVATLTQPPAIAAML